MGNTTDRDYTAVVVKVGKEFMMGYLPKGNYVYPGDEVEFETHKRGVVLMVDDYRSYEDLQEMEKSTGSEFTKVIAFFKRHEITRED
jgi:plastocyanin